MQWKPTSLTWNVNAHNSECTYELIYTYNESTVDLEAANDQMKWSLCNDVK